MPIKPENKVRYPSDWDQVRERVRARSGNCCEGSPAFPDCRIPNGWYRNNDTGEVTDDPMMFEAWTLADGNSASRIVLTVGHLDHTPEHCADDNLRHWCQRCHLNYDREHHAQTAYMTRMKNRNTMELPL